MGVEFLDVAESELSPGSNQLLCGFSEDATKGLRQSLQSLGPDHSELRQAFGVPSGPVRQLLFQARAGLQEHICDGSTKFKFLDAPSQGLPCEGGVTGFVDGYTAICFAELRIECAPMFRCNAAL